MSRDTIDDLADNLAPAGLRVRGEGRRVVVTRRTHWLGAALGVAAAVCAVAGLPMIVHAAAGVARLDGAGLGEAARALAVPVGWTVVFGAAALVILNASVPAALVVDMGRRTVTLRTLLRRQSAAMDDLDRVVLKVHKGHGGWVPEIAVERVRGAALSLGTLKAEWERTDAMVACLPAAQALARLLGVEMEG